MASRNIEITGKALKSRNIWSIRMTAYRKDGISGKIQSSPYATTNKTTGIYIKETKSKQRAEAMIPEYVEQWRKELQNEPIVDRTSVSYYIEKWLEEQSRCVSELTMTYYRGYADKHILPFFEDVTISDFTVRKVQEYIDLKCQTLKVDSVRKHLVVINGAANEATKDELMNGNFNSKGLRFPRKPEEKFEAKIYTEEQVLQLFEAVVKEGEPIRSAFVLAYFYGLRRSELCGLRWCDVDFDNNSIYIRNTVKQEGSRIFEEEITKTKAGTREMEIVPETLEYLVNLKARHEELGLTRGKVVAWENDALVQPDYITRRRKELMKKYGLEVVRLHDLRHTHATQLLLAGVPLFEVSKHLGHESISTTSDIYGHLTQAQRSNIANTTGKIFSCLDFCLHEPSASVE